MNRNSLIGGTLLIAAFVILQSTLLGKLAINGVTPDFALIILVFISNSSGPVKGQGLGFITGLVQDLISTSPLGFNCLVRTLIGFIYGKIRGKLFLDSILLPVLFVLSATLFKEFFSSLLVLLFMPESGIGFFDKAFLIELGLNAFFSPFIFALVKFLKLYNTNYRDGY
ncbi:MAG: rod shape-determining protein MreD [Spirochaetales bacterium]|nr:rod shape-determining protein MreD [Spirochaetales bacterium]